MILRIADEFTRTPGSRYESEGEFSGEVFRRNFLCPKVREAILTNNSLLVDLDGTAGYGTSFLEEAFGGLIREDSFQVANLRRILKFKSTEEEYLVDDIWNYMEEAEGQAQ